MLASTVRRSHAPDVTSVSGRGGSRQGANKAGSKGGERDRGWVGVEEGEGSTDEGDEEDEPRGQAGMGRSCGANRGEKGEQDPGAKGTSGDGDGDGGGGGGGGGESGLGWGRLRRTGDGAGVGPGGVGRGEVRAPGASPLPLPLPSPHHHLHHPHLSPISRSGVAPDPRRPRSDGTPIRRRPDQTAPRSRDAPTRGAPTPPPPDPEGRLPHSSAATAPRVISATRRAHRRTKRDQR